MPFTFAHPLFAYPLKYVRPRWFSMTGLVLGSMAPDFEYFLMLEPYRTIGHTPVGLLLHAIPFSVLFALLFHHVVKRSLAVHLPSLWQLDRRAALLAGDWRLRSVRAWAVFLGSIGLGFLSHLLIDACTHAGGDVVLRIPFLSEVLIAGLPVFKLLQYGLSLFGLMFIGGHVCFRLYRVRPSMSRKLYVSRLQKVAYWAIVMLVAVAVTGVKVAVTQSDNLIGILVVAPISGLALGLVVASILMNSAPFSQQS